MARSGAGGVVFGVGCILVGGALEFLALDSQRESEAARAVVAAPLPAASEPAASVTPAHDAGAASAPSGSAAAGALSAAPMASASAGLDAGPNAFRYPRGDVILPREEAARARALSLRLVRNDNLRITIEGYADEAGVEDKTKLARRRALIIRQIFVDMGVQPDRVSLVTPDLATAPGASGVARVRTQPPLAEEAK